MLARLTREYLERPLLVHSHGFFSFLSWGSLVIVMGWGMGEEAVDFFSCVGAATETALLKTGDLPQVYRSWLVLARVLKIKTAFLGK